MENEETTLNEYKEAKRSLAFELGNLIAGFETKYLVTVTDLELVIPQQTSVGINSKRVKIKVV